MEPNTNISVFKKSKILLVLACIEIIIGIYIHFFSEAQYVRETIWYFTGGLEEFLLILLPLSAIIVPFVTLFTKTKGLYYVSAVISFILSAFSILLLLFTLIFNGRF